MIEHDSLDSGSILRDADDQVMTVSLEERTNLTRTVYLMDGETYEELQSLSDEFEESFKGPAD